MNKDALYRTRELIQREFGNLQDLPEDLRNTVVNTYYEFCCLDLELKQGPHHHPCYYRATNRRPRGAYLNRTAKFYNEVAHAQAAVKNLPTIIGGIREMKRDGEYRGYRAAVSLALYSLKYRIPGAMNKTALRLAIERFFYAVRVDEIPQLWKSL